jgi:hypothetical protein
MAPAFDTGSEPVRGLGLIRTDNALTPFTRYSRPAILVVFLVEFMVLSPPSCSRRVNYGSALPCYVMSEVDTASVIILAIFNIQKISGGDVHFYGQARLFAWTDAPSRWHRVSNVTLRAERS